jgi:hypothetical protein
VERTWRSELACESYAETILTPLAAKSLEEFCVFIFGRVRPRQEISSLRQRFLSFSRPAWALQDTHIIGFKFNFAR